MKIHFSENGSAFIHILSPHLSTQPRVSALWRLVGLLMSTQGQLGSIEASGLVFVYIHHSRISARRLIMMNHGNAGCFTNLIIILSLLLTEISVYIIYIHNVTKVCLISPKVLHGLSSFNFSRSKKDLPEEDHFFLSSYNVILFYDILYGSFFEL